MLYHLKRKPLAPYVKRAERAFHACALTYPAVHSFTFDCAYAYYQRTVRLIHARRYCLHFPYDCRCRRNSIPAKLRRHAMRSAPAHGYAEIVAACHKVTVHYGHAA